jgi:hypothetical protein
VALDTNMQRCVFDFMVPISATKYINVKDPHIMSACLVNGLVAGGIQVDGNGSAVQNICLFQAGFPYSGTGYYEYDGGLNSQTNISLVTDSTSYNNYISASSRLRRTAAFSNGDTSPSVKGHELFWCGNTSPTSITTFDDGNPGQSITITFTTANTTLVHSGGLTLAGSTNVTPTSGSTISLLYDAGYGVWRETGRTIA